MNAAGECGLAAANSCSFIQIPGAFAANAQSANGRDGHDIFCGDFLNYDDDAVVSGAVSCELFRYFKLLMSVIPKHGINKKLVIHTNDILIISANARPFRFRHVVTGKSIQNGAALAGYSLDATQTPC